MRKKGETQAYLMIPVYHLYTTKKAVGLEQNPKALHK